MRQVRVLLAHDHPIVRNGLRCLLERDLNIRVIGEAATSREAIVLAEFQHPDAAVLDITLHSVRGVDAAQTIASREPRTRIIILGAVADQGYVQEALNAGACGYVLADAAQVDLLRAVSVVAAGGIFLSPAVSSTLIDQWNRLNPLHDPASIEREKRLFSLLAEGRRETEIAEILRISEAQAHSECEGVRKLLERFSLSKARLCSRSSN